ncbi:MAG: SPOR domain-containing protein [Candidatus Saelkia tenebricola]|nr:SPOR domain-containing protein [Candidatus Saelkia tenebricola]
MAEYKEVLFPEFKGDSSKTPYKRKKHRNFPFIRKKHYNLSEERIALFLLIFLFSLVSIYVLGYKRGRLHPEELSPEVVFSNIVVKSTPQETTLLEDVDSKALFQNVGEVDAKYTLQLVAYKNLSYADAEKRKLTELGYSAYISEQGRYKIVYVGKYGNEKDAKKSLSKLKETYKDAFIKKIKGGN